MNVGLFKGPSVSTHVRLCTQNLEFPGTIASENGVQPRGEIEVSSLPYSIRKRLKFFSAFLKTSRLFLVVFIVFSKVSINLEGGRFFTAESLRNTQIDSIKIKKCCSPKGTRKMKRQASQWKKMYAAHTTDKDLVSKMYKELIQIS